MDSLNNGAGPSLTAQRHTSMRMRVIAWSVPAAILLQAMLAGQASFVSPELFELHGWIGSAVLVLSTLTLFGAFLARERGVVLLLGLLVASGSFAQIGLGYIGRRAGLTLASVIHVPLGVALLGLSVAVAMLLTLPRPIIEHEQADER